MEYRSKKPTKPVPSDDQELSLLVDKFDSSHISGDKHGITPPSSAAAASPPEHGEDKHVKSKKSQVSEKAPCRRDVCALHEAFRALKTRKIEGETVTELLKTTFSGDRWKLVPSQSTRRVVSIEHGCIKDAYKHKFYSDNNGYALDKPREILAVHNMGSLMMNLITEKNKLSWIILRTEYPLNSVSISGIQSKKHGTCGIADCILYDYSLDCLVVLDWKCTCEVNSWKSLSQIEGMHKLRAYYQTLVYSYMIDELIRDNEKAYPVLEGLRCDVCAVYSVALDTLTDSMTTLCLEAFHSNAEQRSSLLFEKYGYRILKPVFPGNNQRQENAEKLMNEVMPMLVKN